MWMRGKDHSHRKLKLKTFNSVLNKLVSHMFPGGEGDGADHRRQDYEERHAPSLH